MMHCVSKNNVLLERSFCGALDLKYSVGCLKLKYLSNPENPYSCTFSERVDFLSVYVHSLSTYTSIIGPPKEGCALQLKVYKYGVSFQFFFV